jgi:hypothetical protein
MNAEDTQQKDTDEQDAGQDDGAITDDKAADDKAREKAKEMAKVYDEDRPTVVLPGSDGTVAGTAINDWLDDEGNPIYGKEGDGGEKAESKSEDHESKSEDHG